MASQVAQQMSKKRKFIADGVFKAELNKFLMKELAEDGYRFVELLYSGYSNMLFAAVSKCAKRPSALR